MKVGIVSGKAMIKTILSPRRVVTLPEELLTNPRNSVAPHSDLAISQLRYL
jgi:hypothetical protein